MSFPLSSIETFLEKYEVLQNSKDNSTELKQILKSVFDYAVQLNETEMSGLSELLIQDMDIEQIWEQIRLENNPLKKWLNKEYIQISSNPISFLDDADENSSGAKELDEDDNAEDEEDENGEENENVEEEEEEEEEEEIDNDNDIEEEEENYEEINNKTNTQRNEDDEDEFADLDKDEEGYKVRSDKFFNEDDLERFEELDEKLFGDMEDEENEKNNNNEDDDDEFDEENDDENDEDDEDAYLDVTKSYEDPKNKSKFDDYKYEDFFEPPDDEKEEKDEIEGDILNSNFQIKQNKLLDKIIELEAEAVEDKPWMLKGEITAKSRPENSTLETDIDYDRQVPVAPLLTAESNQSLEEIIKKRIIEESWDDVIRMKIEEKPEKELVELSQEKSKEGLGDIYEKEYMEKSGKWDPDEETKKAEAEADQIFRKICYYLDALSNFHFTPKPVINELEIKVNAPALKMEESIPLSYSMANQKTPEEIMSKQKEKLKDTKEMTSDEKQKKRQLKKAVKRKVKKEKEAINKIVQRLNPGLGNKYSKEKIKDALLQRNVKEGKVTGNVTKTSSALFNQLQDEMEKQKASFRGEDEPPKKKRKSNKVAEYKL